MDADERKRRLAAVDAELSALYREGVHRKERIAACRQQIAHLEFDEKVTAIEAAGVPATDAYRKAAREHPALWNAANPIHRN